MEWQIPIQKVEIGNIHIGQPWGRTRGQAKPMVPISYFGTQFRMPFMSLLFPPLSIVEYNQTTGKLVLDMGISPLACIKLNTLQDTFIDAIVYHQNSWFQTHFTKEQVKEGFQPIIEGNHIVLHCPFHPGAKGNSVPVYHASTGASREEGSSSNAAPSRGEGGAKAIQSQLQPSDLRPGQRIRVGIKIHGISFLTNQAGEWSGRCRLQHRVQGMIFVRPPPFLTTA